MVESLTIRSANKGDAASVATLLTELGYPQESDVTTRALQSVLEDPKQTAFVAELAGVVVGLAAVTTLFYFHLGQPIARLASLVVSTEVRSQGVGRQLLRAAERWAAEQGCAEIELTSSMRREQAHRFYEHEGYRHSSYRFVRSLGRKD